MFRVDAESVEEYFGFDPLREKDLRAVDCAIRNSAPALKRWFKAGSKEGDPGMRMTMIGYGHFSYAVKSSTLPVKWPIVGMALQKNYLSLYCSVGKANRQSRPFILEHAESLGKIKMRPKGVINFVSADDLDLPGLQRILSALQVGLERGELQARFGRVAPR